MRALVTGAAGFIGSAVARRLLLEGHDVVGLDSLTTYYSPALKRENLVSLQSDRFEAVLGDLNSVDLVRTLDGVEVVYHQAGQPGVRNSWGNEFRQYTASNINATQRLLEAACEVSPQPRIVFASSSSVYGEAERYPTIESDLPRPYSPYGVSKLAAEHLCGLYAKARGLRTVSLRYFTVYGPGQRPDMAFTRFITAALRGEAISLYGTGEQIRDFTFIDDVVEANLAAASETARGGSVFNVAGGSMVSVNEVLERIAHIVGVEPKIDRYEAGVGDVSRTGGGTDLIREQLGWCPVVSLDDGLREHVAWLRRRLVE